MKKTILLILLPIFISSCASTTITTENYNDSRLAKQKKELELLGFQVDYLPKKSQNKNKK